MKTKELRQHLDRHPLEILWMLTKRSGLLVLLLAVVICTTLALAPATEQLKVPYFATPPGVRVGRVAAEADVAVAERYSFEQNIYRGLAAWLLKRAKQVDLRLASGGRQGLFLVVAGGGETQLSIIQGLVTLSYLLAVGVRFLVFLPLIAFLTGWISSELHQQGGSNSGSYDLLSRLGNGHIFYSGIKLEFDPETQVPNLIALSSVGKATIRKSSLCKTLVDLGVDSLTTRELIGYILYYRDTPFSITDKKGLLIADWAEFALKTTLHAQQYYGGPANWLLPASSENPLRDDLDRALTNTLRRTLAEDVEPELLAIAVLAVAASRILTFENFNQASWVQVSAHPDLQARAILNSMESFTDEYYSEERSIVRQAIVYSKRSILGSSNNFPKKLEQEALALRQVVEILFEDDEERRSSTATISRFLNLRDELLVDWETRFIEAIKSPCGLDRFKCILTAENILYAPLDLVISIFEEIKSPSSLMVLEKAYHRAQATKATWLNSGGSGGSSSIPPHWEPIPLIQSAAAVQATAREHALSPADSACWAVLGPMLKSAHWIETFIAGQDVAPDGLCSESFNGMIEKALVPINVDKLTDAVGAGDHWRSHLTKVKADSKARAKTHVYSEPKQAKRTFIRRVK